MLTLLGFVAFALLAVSFLVEVRIVLTNPNYGDVTGVLQTFWQFLLAAATVGSFLLAIYNALSEEPSSDGPTRTFVIRGENHDIDVHLQGIDRPDPDDPSSQGEENSEDESESSTATRGERERKREREENRDQECEGKSDRTVDETD